MDDKERISKLKELLFDDENARKELDGEQVSKLYFVAGLAQACVQDAIYEKVSNKYRWIEPLLLDIASKAFDNAIEIRKELQDEDR